MKTNLLIILAISALFAGCQPEKLPDIGDPVNKLESVQGNWQLDKVMQVDLNAVKYNFPYKELDVTSVAPFNQFKINFTLSNGEPASFTTTPGGSPKVIPFADGSWKVDDKNTPLKLNLIKGTDTVKMQFGPYNNLQSGTLVMQQIKSLDGKSLLRYDYYFKKI